MFARYVIMLPPFLFALPPLSGLYPKSPSTVPFPSNFFQKIFYPSTADYQKKCAKSLHSHCTFSKKTIPLPLTIAKTPRKGHTLFQLFSKNFCLSTVDYQKKHPKRSHPFRKKNLKNITSTPVYVRFLPPKYFTVFKKIEKFLYPHLPYHRLEAVFTPFSPQKQSARRRLAFLHLPMLYPKRYHFALQFSEKIRKSIVTTLVTIKITPLFCCTVFQKIHKKSSSTVVYHLFTPILRHCF